MSDRIIRSGIKEFSDPPDLSDDRQRRPGGGHKSRIEEQPELLKALDELINPGTRGDPMLSLRTEPDIELRTTRIPHPHPLALMNQKINVLALFPTEPQRYGPFGPGYKNPHRDPSEYFGKIPEESRQKIIEDIAALSLLTKDDPPIFMQYGMAPNDPDPTDGRVQGWRVHHVNFGVALLDKAKQMKVPAYLKYRGAKVAFASDVEFFRISC